MADLVIIGHTLPDDPDDIRHGFKAALYDAGACVVVAPGQPAVAWEPSLAVEEAIGAAMPLLLSADRVTILVAQEGRAEPEQPQPLLRTLEQAGVATKVVWFELEGRKSVPPCWPGLSRSRQTCWSWAPTPITASRRR
jgi:hypothetical protein